MRCTIWLPRLLATRCSSALRLLTLVLLSTLATGCPLERAEGHRPPTIQECKEALESFGITDCEEYCLPVQ